MGGVRACSRGDLWEGGRILLTETRTGPLLVSSGQRGAKPGLRPHRERLWRDRVLVRWSVD